MAITVLTNAQVIVNSIDLSDHVDQVTVEDTRDAVDVTAMGATNKAYTKGLGDAKITIEFLQDFAAGKTYATLQPLIGSTSTVQVEVRPVNAARSATNPAMVLQAFLMSFNALDGKVGDASRISAEFINGSQSGLTYATS
jgi:hypothetical protein